MSAIKKVVKTNVKVTFCVLVLVIIFLFRTNTGTIRLNNRTYEYRQKNNVSTAEEQVFVASFTYAQIELCALFKRKGNNA